MERNQVSEKFRKRSDLFMGFAGREKVFIPEKERATHMQIIGSTGTGKSKMLEYMIRQDILNRQGLCLIDRTPRCTTTWCSGWAGWAQAR